MGMEENVEETYKWWRVGMSYKVRNGNGYNREYIGERVMISELSESGRMYSISKHINKIIGEE